LLGELECRFDLVAVVKRRGNPGKLELPLHIFDFAAVSDPDLSFYFSNHKSKIGDRKFSFAFRGARRDARLPNQFFGGGRGK
jgi:hypothetical protein